MVRRPGRSLHLKHGRPVAFYSDKYTVFRVPKPNEHMTGMTQFGRALAELNIETICANSSQAKGRVERANRTLQDRLVKELRIAGISNMEDGNAFLEGFVKHYSVRLCHARQRVLASMPPSPVPEAILQQHQIQW
ncbi:hypothetical protein XMM379_002906 [Aliiroseovarius sp. xm-m-379]|nr:hypothetical protein [Aliiroseovarius sp. xm-d-517]NRP26197.1 hypothetical protein [Aliiroseovarius sp. xm-m-379]NRP32117.1 hypothetical protein [Aliiroseovarius sp. xm-m-314]NRP34996.1 hypothetical protein [Aliiroseovarius sp. xm-a-104]NRP42834.1 hypothetical protein [Aliiroseovarius sp. xm-m-339-2]NRP45655.1 hypothetical protein [Aliiroseovarius sp. xm-m-378]NRP51264.1 hypothetical protein [Aliiroseovarius sp. xm-m-354]NRP63709.1 hypothetical protein [Aliiroseovarius sp. xm-a-151]NRP66